MIVEIINQHLYPLCMELRSTSWSTQDEVEMHYFCDDRLPIGTVPVLLKLSHDGSTKHRTAAGSLGSRSTCYVMQCNAIQKPTSLAVPYTLWMSSIR